ncbi:MAG: hypothetical protein O3B13_20830 [Planctomycetota bacterium]|nr:hypothetical protein [Planctomycetota bacterium]
MKQLDELVFAATRSMNPDDSPSPQQDCVDTSSNSRPSTTGEMSIDMDDENEPETELQLEDVEFGQSSAVAESDTLALSETVSKDLASEHSIDGSAREFADIDLESSVDDLERLLHETDLEIEEPESCLSEFTFGGETDELISRETINFRVSEDRSSATMNDPVAKRQLFESEYDVEDESHDVGAHQNLTDWSKVDACETAEEHEASLESGVLSRFNLERLDETCPEAVIKGDDASDDHSIDETVSAFDESDEGFQFDEDLTAGDLEESLGIQLTDEPSVCDLKITSDSTESSSRFPHAGHQARSWFESKFLAGDDDDPENDDDNGVAASESETIVDSLEVAADISGGVSPAEAHLSTSDSACELRQRLATMFDLPTLTEETKPVASGASLDGRLNSYRNEVPENQTGNEDCGEERHTQHEAPDSGVLPIGECDAAIEFGTSSVDESSSAFETETLDAFPDSSAEDTDSAGTERRSGSTFEPVVDDHEEEESISAYMERLLARTRQAARGKDHQKEDVSSEHETAECTELAVTEAPSKIIEKHTISGNDNDKAAAEAWHEENPRHRQNKDQVRADVQILRQIANQSARSAVAVASRRVVRTQVIVKTIASILAIGTGVASLLLDVSLVFGLFVIGIGLIFSVDLGMTIFRNWKQLYELRKSAAAIARNTASSESGK